MIWQQKTKRPFRVLTQADVEKLMPTDDEVAKMPSTPSSHPPYVCVCVCVWAVCVCAKLSRKDSAQQVFHAARQQMVKHREAFALEDGSAADTPTHTDEHTHSLTRTHTPDAHSLVQTAFWKKVQEKGLDTNPAMQNVVLDDLVRARVITPQERDAMAQVLVECVSVSECEA